MFRLFLMSMLMLFFISETCLAMLPQPSVDSIQKVRQRNLPTHKHTDDCEKTSAEPVQIVCILDRSGSMRSLAEDTIGGYNSFLDKQKNESGEVEITTILFDDQYEKIVDAVNLNEVKELTSAEYYARGNTALLDAVGKTIMEIAGNMEKNKICPAKRRVLVMIMTDGRENASKEYNKASVKEMIDTSTNDYNWNYIFMGANIDSVAEAEAIGIKSRHAMNYAANSEGIHKTFSMMDSAASEVREKGTVSEEWKDDESETK